MSAKDIRISPIDAQSARKVITRTHYSRRFVKNSQLHIGVFLYGRLEGAMSFGPPMDRRKILPLVEGTAWNGMLELNRMAFTERLPRNSESRALGVTFRMMKKLRPDIEWIVSFADATSCGDGAIYRASGFKLVGIKKNNQLWKLPDGSTESRLTMIDQRGSARNRIFSRMTATKGGHIMNDGAASMKQFIDAGAVPLDGYQLKYIYFLNKEARSRLTVPIIPFSRIDELGARMYRGSRESVGSVGSDTSDYQSGEGGANPTPTLQEMSTQ